MKTKSISPRVREIDDSIPRPFRAKGTGELLAIEPGALDLQFLLPAKRASPPTEWTDDGIAIVHVRGPLEQHRQYGWDSYEDILCRVQCAMEGSSGDVDEESGEATAVNAHDPARAVILCLDSPGGLASGSMDAHRMLRAYSKRYGCPIYAYANESANSAAYALASGCQEIWLPDTGVVGSIGVIATLFDRTQQNEKMGARIELVTSGEYKGDGHADRPLDDGIRGRMQKRVDAFADVFFKCVAKARDTTPKAIAALEAGVFVGPAAVAVGVADGVARWDKFVALVSATLEPNEGTQQGPSPSRAA